MFNKAIKEYEEIFDHRSTDKDVVRTLAELYKDTEQFFSAISVYNILSNLLEQNEEIAEVQLILADLNEKTRDYPAAFEAYKTRLEFIRPTFLQIKNLQNFISGLKTILNRFETFALYIIFCDRT